MGNPTPWRIEMFAPLPASTKVSSGFSFAIPVETNVHPELLRVPGFARTQRAAGVPSGMVAASPSGPGEISGALPLFGNPSGIRTRGLGDFFCQGLVGLTNFFPTILGFPY